MPKNNSFTVDVSDLHWLSDLRLSEALIRQAVTSEYNRASEAGLASRVRLMRSGQPLPGSPTHTILPTDTCKAFDPRRAAIAAHQAYEDGYTIEFRFADLTFPDVLYARRQLERIIGTRMQASIFLSPPGTTALRPHHDGTDVTVVQVAGRKYWPLGTRDRYPITEGGREDISPSTASGCQLEPGSLLFVPRGTAHRPTSEGNEPSIHVSFITHLETQFEEARRMVAAYRNDLKAAPEQGEPSDAPGSYTGEEGIRLFEQLDTIHAAVNRAPSDFPSVTALVDSRPDAGEQLRAGLRREKVAERFAPARAELLSLSPLSR